MTIGPQATECSTTILPQVVVVDDALLERSLICKYLSQDAQVALQSQHATLSEYLAEVAAREACGCLIVSLHRGTADDWPLLQTLATQHREMIFIFLCTAGLEPSKLKRLFGDRATLLNCSLHSRASEVAQQLRQEVNRQVSKFPTPVRQETGSTNASAGPTELAAPRPIEITRRRIPSRSSARAESVRSGAFPRAKSLRVRLLVIGGSTGAPAAVTKLLQQLPADFPLPIAVSLHMLEDFTERLAQSLDRAVKLKCVEAKNNELLHPGTVYIAKGDHHLTIAKNEHGRFVSHLNRDPPEHFARPAVNQLFRSAAMAAGPATMAVILTGIGADGLEGAELLSQRGATVVAQDKASSTVWGMPAAVVDAGLADQVLDPVEIGQFVARKVVVEQKRCNL